ncbi:hypothetical protein I4U23_019548 [Adineta vaga]|nr:hypothetical protein I4U23_019548 [Adineta vaga]
MNSSFHSSVSMSSDVDILPSINNHIHHNHTDLPNKSFKRSRSPSLTRDDDDDDNNNNNDTNHSSTTMDTPTKRSRKKRTTTDIDESLGQDLSADKLHVYRWPTGEPHADLHVLQEQICDYLSLKSFKRKYPDIYRRIVDLHEREYLKSQNVVTETQCDLGLTALKLDEVLELMSTDYPEKCHQFNQAWQQKRRALVVTSNNDTIPSHISITNSNQSSSSTPQTVTSIDNGEKNRATRFRQDLIRSTVDFNTQLQRERLQDRKACFDLQTMQIHYPANRQFRLPSHLTKIGSYPLALLPGQYQDSYIKYKSEELKYMPINTALYYYPKPLSFIQKDRFSQQTASSDEEDESTSKTRLILSNQQRPLTPQSPHIVNGINNTIATPSSSRLNKPSTPISVNSHSNLCHICKITQNEHDDELVTCTSCHHSFHPVCLDANNEMLKIIKTYPWQCIDCKSCAKCNKTHDEANMMFCDRCDRGYHTYCVGLDGIPDGSWQCSACDSPTNSTPASSPVPVTKGKRGRPSISSRLSSPQQSTSSPKIDTAPTRISSRRSRQIISTPLSPSNNTNHSSNSSSADLSTTNSSTVNLTLTRHQQQWITTPTMSTEIKSKT